MIDKNRDVFNELAAEFDRRADPYGCFDALYTVANRDTSVIPWAENGPNPHLAAFCALHRLPKAGSTAIVVGCGLGDDAEYLAAKGARVTAFDLAPQGIAWCRERWPGTPVDYQVANLLELPAAWRQAFDFVLESYTIQAIPLEVRAAAIEAVAGLVAPGGDLVLICRGRGADQPPGERPWPLTEIDLNALIAHGLTIDSFEDFDDPFKPGIRRFRLHATRKA